VVGGIPEQTVRVLTNLSAVLEAAGTSLGGVLTTTVFRAYMKYCGAMNEGYAPRFGAHRPARSTIQAAGLPKGCRVEIECVALRKSL
jgi:2-iminobutanoate/2-iminopropanoate deaminase